MQSTIDGKKIIEAAELPEAIIEHERLVLSPEEREFYDALERGTRTIVNKYVEEGTVLKNYMSMLGLLNKLRQACCHPHLLKAQKQTAEVEHLDKDRYVAMSHEVNALVKEAGPHAECPLCLEVIKRTDGVLSTLCGHAYCRGCVQEYLRGPSGNHGCPTCGKGLNDPALVSFAGFFEARVPELDLDAAFGEPEVPVDMSKLPEVPSSAKLDRCLAILDEIRDKAPEEKTIVFSEWRRVPPLLAAPLKKRGIKWVQINGDMNSKARNDAVNTFFARTDTTVLLLSLKCGNLGLNLTCANHAILLEPWWNPMVEAQAIGRIQRMGQSRQVLVHKLTVANTVEDRILELQRTKMDLFQAAFSGQGSRGRLLTEGELIGLFAGGQGGGQ